MYNPSLSQQREQLDEPTRLNRLLSRLTGCSRRQADDWITKGRVTVNGQQAMLGQVINKPFRARLALDGKALGLEKTPRPMVVAFYKPKDCLTTRRDPQGRRTVYQYLPDWAAALKPVGRLDRNTTGLLLFTNDGQLHHALLSAEHHVEKTYKVTLQPVPVNPAQLAKQWLKGLWFEKEQQTAVATGVVQVADDTFMLTLATGFNRQIHRMAEALGYKVTALKRECFGPVLCRGLAPKQTLLLTRNQVAPLYKAAGLPVPTLYLGKRQVPRRRKPQRAR